MQPNQQNHINKVTQWTGRGRGGKILHKTMYNRNQNQSHSMNKWHEDNTLNMTLYYNMLEVFEQRNKILLTNFPSHFVEDVLNRVPINYTNYNFVKQYIDPYDDHGAFVNQNYSSAYHNQGQPQLERYVFSGYATGNVLKQVCVVLSLWNECGQFPIKFMEIDCLKAFDGTQSQIEHMEKLTPYIADIFKMISQLQPESEKSPRALQKEICEFLCQLETSGFLTCLGIRTTNASQWTVLPPIKRDLEDMINRLNKPLSQEELNHNPNPSMLTKGARELTKHASRNTPNSSYWIAKGTMNGWTEEQKNIKAQEVIGQLIEQCRWLSIHTLHQNTDIFILEIRNLEGFGARWEIQGQFKGLIEPQLQFMNLKKFKNEQEE